MNEFINYCTLILLILITSIVLSHHFLSDNLIGKYSKAIIDFIILNKVEKTIATIEKTKNHSENFLDIKTLLMKFNFEEAEEIYNNDLDQITNELKSKNLSNKEKNRILLHFHSKYTEVKEFAKSISPYGYERKRLIIKDSNE